MCHIDDRLFIAELLYEINERYRQEVAWLYSHNFIHHMYKESDVAKLQRIGVARRKSNTWLRSVIDGIKRNCPD